MASCRRPKLGTLVDQPDLELLCIRNLLASPNERVFFKDALGMSVVGEGIETEGQLGELAALGCDEGQGFFLEHPMPPERLAALPLTAGR